MRTWEEAGTFRQRSVTLISSDHFVSSLCSNILLYLLLIKSISPAHEAMALSSLLTSYCDARQLDRRSRIAYRLHKVQLTTQPGHTRMLQLMTRLHIAKWPLLNQLTTSSLAPLLPSNVAAFLSLQVASVAVLHIQRKIRARRLKSA